MKVMELKKKSSLKENLNMIRPYLSDLINDHKTQGVWEVHSSNTVINYKTQKEWKIQLSVTINFISPEDSNETRTMHTKSHNVEIRMGDKTDEIIKELFKSLLQKYQEGLEESMKVSEFAFDCVDLLEYKLNKTSQKGTNQI